ncbi:GIY-YIG catalytic domain-containing protein [Actinopolymorpha cephalotaxi]|uniref:GIY-YIG catalytic domain-containing protein n=1 Tax=Actinopolymorpha cephalotaxi TaxID=504797 RepID=A0A1I2N3Q3_9ACTN|nr:GIY-YIG nuclease family protein [Actinopolymorpha cephalotaxi]NYH85698.1 putative GIY-YIG superfamily endonuclease [Actinopolymorpha cephalotaxi]SFF98392.1 GIY-YIG catalytic domain-containing protein [Actinopolymorpha cephalotaxi]
MTEANGWGAVGLGVLRAAAAEAPRHPGVYLFLDDNEEVIYVGKATNLRQRLSQHAATKVPRSRLDQRYDLVRRVAWEPAADEQAAFWREEELMFALRPLFNADPDLRSPNPITKEPLVPYIVVTETPEGMHSFTLEPVVPKGGRAYGCFPHLGKGMGSRLGVTCSDGYTAFLRLLWAASGDGLHVPASITRSAPVSFTVAAPAGIHDDLHRFLSGTSPRLTDGLLQAASRRPAYMQPALRRDRDAALGFFDSGPRSVRARRLRHRVRARVLDVDTYRRLVRTEISPVIDPARTGSPS